jgi:outer membrane protein assembly factor BamB
MSRTVPAVDAGLVVSMGPKCHVLCTDAETGEFRWGLDLVREYGSTVPLWYTAQCPLIDDGVAVLAPAGRALMIGVDCASGKVLWESPNPNGWQMSHSSVMRVVVAGKPIYVYCALGGVVGVSADKHDQGRILWQNAEWDHQVVAPSPVPLGTDGRIFLTAGYGVGSMMLQVRSGADGFEAETLYRLERTVFACEQQSPVFYKGCLFGVLPNDAGALKRQFACLHPDGRLLWSSGKEARFGLGPFIIADDKIFLLNDDGTLTLLKASTERYIPLAQARMLQGRDAWAPMAIAAGRLLLRDSKRLICVDVRG